MRSPPTGIACLLALLLVPCELVAAASDLRRHTLFGPMTRASLENLQRALERTHAHGEAVLLEIDSPGGPLALGESAMIAMLFSGAPVVAYVPSGGRASGSAVLPLMAAGEIAAARDARLGTRNGLGQDVRLRLGSFGTRLFDAAQASRSGAVDWLVVSLADGSEVSGREARDRGIVGRLAANADSLARELAGHEVFVPLTGERVRLSGRLVHEETPFARRVASSIATPSRSVPLLLAGFLLLALLPATRPSLRLGLLGVAAVATSAAALRGLPPRPIATLFVALVFLAAWAAPHLGRTQALLVALLVAPLAAVACATFVDPAPVGYYLAEDASPSWSVSAVTGIAFAIAIAFVARRRSLRWTA